MIKLNHGLSVWQKPRTSSHKLSVSYGTFSNTINDREEARVVCLDISKAFDRVWHPGLLVKLRTLGFAGKLLHWLADYLRNRSMKVILNGKSSSTKFINAGVPQGSILGPLLFIVFIDDITLDISSTSILYADDVTLMSFIKSKEERIPAAASLNQDFATLRSGLPPGMSSLELQSATLSLYQIDKMQKTAIPASSSLAQP